jgi:hypothetical protein
MYRYLAALLLATSVWAQFQTAQQYPPAGYPQYQPPDNQGQEAGTDQQHGVARISVAQGDVNVKRGDNGQLSGAIVNAPLMSQDRLETSPGSRAEVQFDAANVIRLAPNTDIGLPNLAYQRYQVQLGMGTIMVRVLSNSPAQFEIDTPSVAFHPTSQGEYRISVFDNGTSEISVRSGRVEMSGPRGSQIVNQGQSLLVRGDPADPEFQSAYEPPRDQFDEWSASRDAELLSASSSQYLSPDVDGAADLDRYGNWVPSQYGQVWEPQVQSTDWSPYSDGQWTYAGYYGWTWVGYEPWGWAPYHYGRWFWNTGRGWCWWPGARGFGITWSPALVSFFGFGGGLGWVSLAPFEIFHPWWGRGFRSFDSFRANDLGRYYRNAAIRGGAMTARLGAFGGEGQRYSMATRGQLASADLYRGRIPISPSASSYRFSERPAVANARLSQAAARPFFSRQQQFSSPRSVSGSGGWQHFGSPGNVAPQQRQSFASRPYGSTENAWHSFGQPQSPAARYNYSAPASHYNYNQPSASHYNYRAPSTSHYSAPATPHYSAPSTHSAPSFQGNAGSHSGGGSGRSGGGHSGGGGGGHRR